MSKSEARPNIIFLLADDQRFDTLGCMGNKEIQTPNIDSLGANGTIFDNYYDTTAMCMASRSTIFTGLYEYKHGCHFTHGSLSRKAFMESYPVLLRKSGYRTGFVGKFGIVVSDKQQCYKEIFEFNKMFAAYPVIYTDPDAAYDYVPIDEFDWWAGWAHEPTYKTADARYLRKYSEEFPHETRALGAAASEFIRDSAGQDKPFYLSVCFKAPHCPLEYDPIFSDLYKNDQFTLPSNWGPKGAEHLPKQAIMSRSTRANFDWCPEDVYQENIRKYYRQIYGLDVAVGMIRAELQNNGLSDNTIIIYTSDNGYFCGSHNMGQKELLYEEGARVPLIIYDPRRASRGKEMRCKALAGNIDIAPSILDMAGLEVPGHMDGKSLLPLLDNPGEKFRSSLLLTQFWTGVAQALSLSVVSPDWKYICWFYGDQNMQPAEELYDMNSDRIEMKNQALNPDKQDALKHMRKLYDTYVKDMTQNCAKGNFYPEFAKLADRNVDWFKKDFNSVM